MERVLERVHAFFLVQRNREQDRFHGIVVALVGCGLGVVPHADKEAVEMLVIFAP